MTAERFYDEVSEEEQEFQVADWTLSKMACSCGRQRDVCSDPAHQWYINRDVCYPALTLKWAEREYDKAHDRLKFHDGTFTTWTEKQTDRTPYHYRDGVTLYVGEIDLTPENDFLKAPAGPRQAEALADLPLEEEQQSPPAPSNVDLLDDVHDPPALVRPAVHQVDA